MNGGTTGLCLHCSTALATFWSCSGGCKMLCFSQRKHYYTTIRVGFTYHQANVNTPALGTAPITEGSWGMLPQYTVRGFWGDFSESPRTRCSGGVGWGWHGGELTRPGLAAMSASSCSPTQEQRWVVQWRWDLSHASKPCSNAECVEGFSTVWEQVPWRNSWYFLVPGRLKNTVRM